MICRREVRLFRRAAILLPLALLACKGGGEADEPVQDSVSDVPDPADVVATIELEPAAAAGVVEGEAHRASVTLGAPVAAQEVTSEQYELTVGIDLSAVESP